MTDDNEDQDVETQDEMSTLNALEEVQPEVTLINHRVPKIIISGGPASGKGTQCDFIVKEWNVVHLSSGDMLRAAIESGSEEGKQAQEYMNTGKLVPDQLIIDIVADRVAQKDCQERGFVLDGFPRTAVQVQALLAAGVQCDVFLQIDVDDEAIVQRVAGRRMDPVTGKIYHLKFLPPPEEIMGRLQQRSDDTEDKIKVRLATYHNNLAGISNHFEHCTVVVDTNNKNPNQIWREFRNGMKRFLKFHVLFVLGAPCSGKTALSQEISQKCNGYHCISVSELISSESERGSVDGIVLQQALSSGHEAPLDLVIKLISKEMFSLFNSPRRVSNMIIDGFPNTEESFQKWYEVMGHIASIDYFLYLNTPCEILQSRLDVKRNLLLNNSTSATSAAAASAAASPVVIDIELISNYHERITPLLGSLDRTGKLRTLDGQMNSKVLLKEVTALVTGLQIITPCERTFAMIKPDAVMNGKAHEIHRTLVADGRLTVLASKLVHFDGNAAEEFYAQEFRESTVKNKLKSFMISGPSLCMVLEGPDAINVWREMMGPADPSVAMKNAPHSLRALYGSDECRNAVHGSDSEGSAMHEINFLLSPSGSGHRLVSVLGAKADLNPLKGDCISTFSGSVKSAGGLVLEETCAVIKPLTAELYYDEIMSVIRSHGFEIISEMKTSVTEDRIREFYSEHQEKDYFESLVVYMLTRPVVSLRLRRVGAIAAWRNLMGSTDLTTARVENPSSLRSLFGVDNLKNAVGGSDSVLSAKREISHYFCYASDVAKPTPQEELLLQSPMKKSLPPIVGSPAPLLPPPPPPAKHKSPYELEPISRADMIAMNSYNKAEIHPVLGPVISKLILQRPKNVKEFILRELQGCDGVVE